jgi:hypothetical protein
MIKNKKKRGEGQGGKTIELSVKLSGEPLKQLMIERGRREKETGRMTSISELVREAIAFWYKER